MIACYLAQRGVGESIHGSRSGNIQHTPQRGNNSQSMGLDGRGVGQGYLRSTTHRRKPPSGRAHQDSLIDSILHCIYKEGLTSRAVLRDRTRVIDL